MVAKHLTGLCWVINMTEREAGAEGGKWINTALHSERLRVVSPKNVTWYLKRLFYCHNMQ